MGIRHTLVLLRENTSLNAQVTIAIAKHILRERCCTWHKDPQFTAAVYVGFCEPGLGGVCLGLRERELFTYYIQYIIEIFHCRQLGTGMGS